MWSEKTAYTRFFADNIPALLFIALILPAMLIVDVPVMIWVREFHRDASLYPAYFQFIDPFLRFAGHGSSIAVASVIMIVRGLFFDNRFLSPGIILSAAFISAGIAVQVLKHLFGKARPRMSETALFVGPSLQGGYDSFPSGHTTVVFCIAAVFGRVYPRYAFFLYVAAGIVAVHRVLSHSHFPSDVLAGAATGMITGNVVWIMIKKRTGRLK